MTAETRGSTARISLRPAEENDIGIIHEFIQELADFERLSHEVVATEALLAATRFARSSRVSPPSWIDALRRLRVGTPPAITVDDCSRRDEISC